MTDLRAAAIEMLNASPLDGDLHILMIACKAMPLDAEELAYAERYSKARRALLDALTKEPAA